MLRFMSIPHIHCVEPEVRLMPVLTLELEVRLIPEPPLARELLLQELPDSVLELDVDASGSASPVSTSAVRG